MNEISYLPVKLGRWLNPLDESQKRNVIVLGDQLNKNLFPGRPAVGAIVLLNGIRFEVVGVLGHIGHGNDTWLNVRSYIPFQVMATYFPIKGENHENSISYVNYQPRVTDEHLLAEEDVHKIVARNHAFDWRDQNAFDGWDTIQQSKMIGTIFDAMNMFLGTVGMVTLALGAIGVINIMLVTVSERTREIGLRKALGATKHSILLQFFLEGLILTLGSGLIGMALAAILMAMLGNIEGVGGFDPPEAGAHVSHAGDRQPGAGGCRCRSLSRTQSGHAATGGSAPAGVRPDFVIWQSSNFAIKTTGLQG